tara:strand:- start:527 stop:1144 length:618 start_codon:yes stop_codon:yes gene_type:complete
MKLLMENWRDYQSQVVYEQEFETFFDKHFSALDEGIIDDVISAGRGIKDAVVNVIDDMKDWADDKIRQFVKFMGQKMEAFIAQLKSKGVFKKYRARHETNAVKLLMTNKHIELAVMIFTAAAKMTGGFALEKIIKVPEYLKEFLELLEDPIEKLKDKLGAGIGDVTKMIKKFIVYRKDLNDPRLGYRDWADYGGLAEILSNETDI